MALSAVANTLADKFNDILVNREDFDHAKSVLDRKMDSWKESTIYDLTSGIAKDDLEEFGKLLIEQLGVTKENEKVKIMMVCKQIKFAKSKESTVNDISLVIDEFTSMYGFIAGVKTTEGDYAIAYAFHSLTFKVAKTGWFPWFKTAVKFTPEDVAAIKNNYSKYNALKALKEEGVIKQINFC